MKYRILIFAHVLMSGPALAAIHPLHDVTAAAKPAPLENVAVLSGDKHDKAALPPECSGYYLRPHKATELSRCN